MKFAPVFACSAAALVMSSVCAAATLMKETFDSDSAGVFPAGWSLTYNGAGTNRQVVSTVHKVSAPNALNLVGSSCWSANAFHPVTFPKSVAGVPNLVKAEGEVYVGAMGFGGCTSITSRLSLLDPSVGRWGTSYAGVEFHNDGQMYGVTAGVQPKLGAYSTGKWYHVIIEADLSARTSTLIVNGKRLAAGLPFSQPGAPTGVELVAGHGGGPTAWFDNVSVATVK